MKFSIITVNFNNKSGLEKTIESVVTQQNFSDYEYIIIDGGSTDGSVDVIKNYSNCINYWVSEPDKGIYNAMNKGIKVAKGNFCIFMNSGDCFYNSQVLKKVEKQLNEQADFIAGNYCINGIIKQAPEVITAMTLFKTIDRAICHQALFTKREILVNNPFQEQYKIVADFVNQFHSIILDNAKYQYIDVVICKVEPNGFSALNYQRLSDEKNAYLHTVMPERVYEDYLTFISVKVIESSHVELYSLLRKYNFSKKDLMIIIEVLKFVILLKKAKVRLQSLFQWHIGD